MDSTGDALRQANAEFAADRAMRQGVYAAVEAEWVRGNMPSDWTQTIDQFLDAGLNEDAIVYLANVAQQKRGHIGYRWAYFCGCCWNHIRDMQTRADEIMNAAPRGPRNTQSLTDWTADEIESTITEYIEMVEPYSVQIGTDLMGKGCRHGQPSRDCPDVMCRLVLAALLAGVTTFAGTPEQ